MVVAVSRRKARRPPRVEAQLVGDDLRRRCGALALRRRVRRTLIPPFGAIAIEAPSTFLDLGSARRALRASVRA